MLEQEPVEKLIIEQCLRQGIEFPDKIKNAPSLFMGLELFFKAWLDLSTCRNNGLEEGPIPWEGIRNYCNEYGIVGELREDMYYLVRAVDNVYLKHRREKAKKQMNANRKAKRAHGDKSKS